MIEQTSFVLLTGILQGLKKTFHINEICHGLCKHFAAYNSQ